MLTTEPTPTLTPNRIRRTRVDTRLKRAIESRSLPQELVIVGPAGTGKTYAILAFLHLLAADYPNLRILICRQTRVSLSDSVLVTYEQEILPADGMQWLSAGISRRHRASYPYPSGSEIVLGGMDSPTRIASTAWDLVYVNEAIELDEDGWETIGSRLNRPGRDPRFGFLIGDTNPGDPSHWLKKRIDEGRTVGWDTAHEANPSLHNGKQWTDAGTLYMERLSRLRGTRRKRFLEGLWAAGEGQWFDTFGESHVSTEAAYHRAYPVVLAVDSGVETAAVWFQVRPGSDGPRITVFADYYSFGKPAYDVAREIVAKGISLCGGRFDLGVTDPAGGAATGIGVTVLGEFERAGLKLETWPRYPGSVLDGLKLLESFVAVEPPNMLIYPECVHTIAAFHNYKRAQRAGQWVDRPVDPQHPHEDVMDALRGGLQARFPEGRKPAPAFQRRRI
jgi:DNA polymerase III delta prime subunit